MSHNARSMLEQLLTKECYVKFLHEYNFGHRACLAQSSLMLLGALAMALSACAKVPQAAALLRSGSARGLSRGAALAELAVCTGGAAYAYSRGYPFSTWGELLLLIVQQLTITVLVVSYTSPRRSLVCFALAYGLLVALVASKMIPVAVLWVANACNLPLMLYGKILQIHTNYVTESTGQLSRASCLLLALLGAVRAVTAAAGPGDTLLVAQAALGAATNATLLAQTLRYSRLISKNK